MGQIKVNYQKELEKTLTALEKEGRVPTLLLHACCAPCSSYVLEYLSSYFRITVLFYNPNISEAAEYEKRKEELKRMIGSNMLFRIVGTLPSFMSIIVMMVYFVSNSLQCISPCSVNFSRN